MLSWLRRSPRSSSSSDPELRHDAAQALAGGVAAASGGIEALRLAFEALGRAPTTARSETVDLQVLVRAAVGDGRVLHHAAATGDIATVRAFIDIGADLNAAGVQGATAVMFAARHGKVECLQQLLSGGADVAAGPAP